METRCPVCVEAVERKLMLRHLVRDHGMAHHMAAARLSDECGRVGDAQGQRFYGRLAARYRALVEVHRGALRGLAERGKRRR